MVTVLQKAIQWQALYFAVYRDHLILVIQMKYTLITGEPVIHVRITAAIVKLLQISVSGRRWYLSSRLKCIWSSPDSVWTLLKSGLVFSYLARGDTIPRSYYYKQSKISRNWMFSGLKHNFVI